MRDEEVGADDGRRYSFGDYLNKFSNIREKCQSIINEPRRLEIQDGKHLAETVLSLLPPVDNCEPLSEAALRGMGFDGPKFDDLDKLSLTNDRLKVTHYFGWNFWILDGSCAGPVVRGIWIRLVDDVKTVEHARRIVSALGISPQGDSGNGG